MVRLVHLTSKCHSVTSSEKTQWTKIQWEIKRHFFSNSQTPVACCPLEQHKRHCNLWYLVLFRARTVGLHLSEHDAQTCTVVDCGLFDFLNYKWCLDVTLLCFFSSNCLFLEINVPGRFDDPIYLPHFSCASEFSNFLSLWPSPAACWIFETKRNQRNYVWQSYWTLNQHI